MEKISHRKKGDGEVRSPQGSQAAGFRPLPAQLVSITFFSLGLTELVVLCTRDVFAVASVTAGPTAECVLCFPVLWDTLRPEPRTTAHLGLQKTDLSYYVHINIM